MKRSAMKRSAMKRSVMISDDRVGDEKISDENIGDERIGDARPSRRSGLRSGDRSANGHGHLGPRERTASHLRM